MNKTVLIIAAVLVVIVGIVSGYFLSRYGSGTMLGAASEQGKTVSTENEKGILDSSTFTDVATGMIEKGGLGIDGTHKLLRDGGPSQTVYLTSSVLDLDEFVGKKVEVHGQTIKAQKAAWLMDVGYVKIVE
jgi:hypothetical protein